ncbi:exported hypothetical protein [Desulfamplus magnetovallimortis]|uniref:Uncharacterized protein n=1 Tax=Desulfamplus magnetovallimortis TaxID=1246637 RepID=A0A1W1HFF8_9BACT|nr:hypothetical protein [Desulfamplus magnetovallimortis]SLM31166.1 exported hypothetical protein [Desulfamplus magnetovallimortis]
MRDINRLTSMILICILSCILLIPLNIHAKDIYKIAVVQHQDMLLFSTAFEGFKAGIKELGFAEK